MSIFSIGDQARAYALQSSVGGMKKTLDVLIKEQASGEVADIGQRLQGNTQILRNIENIISEIDIFEQAATEINSEISIMLDALSSIQEIASARAISLVNEPHGESESLLMERSNQAALDLEIIITKLNVEIGGRHLFSGVDVDVPPLVSASDMLNVLHSMVDGMTDAESVVQAVDDWFDAPTGGFFDIAYRPMNIEFRQFSLYQGMQVKLHTTAASNTIRDTLKGLAVAAMVGRSILDGDISQQRELLRRGGEIVYDNDVKIITEQSDIGFKLQVVAECESRSKINKSFLIIARNEMRFADPFETSIAIEDVNTRINMLYSLTDRLSRLKLMDYLR